MNAWWFTLGYERLVISKMLGCIITLGYERLGINKMLHYNREWLQWRGRAGSSFQAQVEVWLCAHSKVKLKFDCARRHSKVK